MISCHIQVELSLSFMPMLQCELVCPYVCMCVCVCARVSLCVCACVRVFVCPIDGHTESQTDIWVRQEDCYIPLRNALVLHKNGFSHRK